MGMTRFTVDPDRYAVDELDGEVIVMDLLEGRLFLLEQGAALVWSALTSGVTQETLTAAAATRYDRPTAESIRTFVADLIAKGILSAVPEDIGPAEPATVPDWPTHLGELRLIEYDDMTKIITMDPIHDVDPRRGWPFDPAP
jgi:hypothetical protein